LKKGIIFDMKVLVFSDSHGYTSKMVQIIENANKVDLIIHLGDIIKDAEKIEDIFDSIKIEYVRGNNDWHSNELNEKIVEVEGKRLLITHGNFYDVKNGYERIFRKGVELKVNAILFGHTHIAYESVRDNILLINPGSISIPAAGQLPSYCILDVTNEGINSKLVRVE
jgi:hypothetical protein